MSWIAIVFDTNVLVKVFLHRFVLRNRSPFTEIFDALMDGAIVPIYSRDTMNELVQKLTHSRDLTLKYQIDPAEALEFVEGIFYELGDFADVTEKRGVSSDEKDRMFEDAALTGGGECGLPRFLVSDDEDLHEPQVLRQLAERGIQVLWSSEFGRDLIPGGGR